MTPALAEAMATGNLALEMIIGGVLALAGSVVCFALLVWASGRRRG